MLFKSTAATAFLSLLASTTSAQGIATVYRYVDSTATVYADYCPCPTQQVVGITNPTSGTGSSGSGSGSGAVVVGSGSGSTGSGSTGSGSTGSGSTGSGSGVVVVPGNNNGGAGVSPGSGLVPIAGGAPGFQIYISLSVGISVGLTTTTIVNGGNTVTSVVTTTATVTTPVTVTSATGTGGAGVLPGQTSSQPFFGNTTSTRPTASSSQNGGASVRPIQTITNPDGSVSTIFSTVASFTPTSGTTSTPSVSSSRTSTSGTSTRTSTSGTGTSTVTTNGSTSTGTSTSGTSTGTTTSGTSTSGTSSSTSAVPTTFNVIVSYPDGTENPLAGFAAYQYSGGGDASSVSTLGGVLVNSGADPGANQASANPAYEFFTSYGASVPINGIPQANNAAGTQGTLAYDPVAAAGANGAPLFYVAPGTANSANIQTAGFTVGATSANDPNSPNKLTGEVDTSGNPTITDATTAITLPGFVFYAPGTSSIYVITQANFDNLLDNGNFFGGDGTTPAKTQIYLYGRVVGANAMTTAPA